VKPAIDRRYTSGPRSRENGVAAAELALILPLFAILLLGIMEIGSMARDHQVLQNAAREGARFSALPDNQIQGVAAVETRIKDRIISYLANEKVTVAASDITVNQDYTMSVGDVFVTASEITIAYRRPVMFTGISNWIALGATSTLHGKALFRNFY
jgi:Flp pilus assembly protein TadG